MENMKYYSELAYVPEGMKSEILEGPLGGKGLTAINPQWRIRRLTEVFGPCGFGWWYRITDKRIETGGKTAKVFVDIELFVRDIESGEVSQPIVGTGGSTFYNSESITDEGFKMAVTDALSVASKYLGLAADVYERRDRSKYGEMEFHPEEDAPEREETSAEVEEPSQVVHEDEPLQGQITLKEDQESPNEEKTPYEEALDFVVPIGSEKGKTMREVKGNERFWRFLSTLRPGGDPAKEKLKNAYETITAYEMRS